MNDIVKEISSPKFHAVNFFWHNIRYTFSGWWLLEWDDGMREYDSKEEFLEEKIFNGKTLEEISSEISEIEFEFEP